MGRQLSIFYQIFASSSESHRCFPGGGNEYNIGQPGNTEVKGTMLHVAIDSAGTSKLQIQFSEPETIIAAFKSSQSFAWSLTVAHHQVTIAIMATSPDPASELM